MSDKIKELLAKESFDINDLADIVVILRSENGCPWDKVQTHKSIKKDFLEEVYEVMEAIDCDSPEMMREELGDVLLQVVFHTVIETENNNFRLDDVITDICKKLIIRHPHVFGSVEADNVETVLKNWDTIKKETKGQETYSDTLKSVPKNFPALMRAQKLSKRAARAGIEYDNAHDISALENAVKALENSKELSWIIIVSLSVIVILIVFIFLVAMPKMTLMQKLVDKLNLVSRENIEGMLVTRAFNSQNFEFKRFDKANGDLKDTGT